MEDGKGEREKERGFADLHWLVLSPSTATATASRRRFPLSRPSLPPMSSFLFSASLSLAALMFPYKYHQILRKNYKLSNF